MTNTIQFIDFIPEVTETKFFGGNKYESIDKCVERANEWIRKNYNRKIINVETVVLPQIYRKKEADSKSVYSIATGGSIVYTFQVVRIWYE
ncbi:hypothetical protein [Nonlabens xiamenensis]|uniref:hypothetical protein n=1 Tax=Nonlabens xiamenensis TaxID=2341043 RepID=UPI000F60B9C1|nr:hypothetical protein [Nonlabens xiamenensis]